MNERLLTNKRDTPRAQLRKLVCLMVLATALSFPNSARADGLMFQPVGATGEVRAEAQRAILWLRDGQWELSIYPVFNRDAGNSAWVVPLPVLPTISEGSADLFDELETITAPVTIEYCYAPSCCCPGDDYYCYASTGLGDTEGAAASVNVWERGTVGSLDYVVLSSIDGDSLETWLAENGYILPEGVSPAIDSLVAEDSFFFAAKLAQDADPDVPVSPVTFIMPELEDPTYPLRLTAAGVPDGTMELILWMVTPQDEIYGVANDFDPIIDYHGVLAFHPLVEDPLYCVWLDGFYSFYTCVDFESFGYELPDTFSDSLQEIIDDHYAVTRYAIDLDAEDMAEDMLFEPTDDPFLVITNEQWDMHLNIFEEMTGACYTCPDCPDNPDPRPGDMGVDYVESGPDAGSIDNGDCFADVGSRGDLGDSLNRPATNGDNSGEVGCSVTPTTTRQPTILLILLVAGLVIARRRRE